MTDPPLIVDGDLLDSTETHVRGSLGLSDGAAVPGNGLVQAFARLAGIVADRINAAANKNFLAFLNLVGISQSPPLAARVPLTFTLAPGSPTDALVGAGSVAAAPTAPGSANPVLFETERDLLVTRAQLTEVIAVEPGRDRLADLGTALTGQDGAGVDPFAGTAALNHRLLIGSDALALGDNQGVDVSFATSAGVSDWVGAVDWSWWDGSVWQPLSPAPDSPVGGDKIAFGVVDPIPATTFGGVTSRWLCATLASPLPATDASVDPTTGAITVTATAAPDAAFADADALDMSQPFAPFGPSGGAAAFVVRADAALGKPGAQVTVRIDLEAGQAPAGQIGLALTWQYWTGGAWHNVTVTTTPDVPGLDPSLLLGSGTVSFTVPADVVAGAWPASTGATGYWLRIGFEGQARYTTVPILSTLAVAFTWAAPRISAVTVTTEILGPARPLLPDVALVNGAPVDPTRDFLAFGTSPAPGDALYLACDAAIDPSRTEVTATIALTAPVANSPSAQLTWEYWDVGSGEWQALAFTDGTANLTTNGTVTFAPPSTLGAVSVGGQSYNWLRVRLVSGDYGHDATYTGSGTNFTFNPATLDPPSVASVRFTYTALRIDKSPELLIVEDWLAQSGPQQISAGPPLEDSNGAFNPFTPMSLSQPVLMLGFSEPFANAGIDLYFSIPPPGALSENGDLVQVAWEYSDGTSWRTLGARDETGGLSSTGLVSFVGPTDLAVTAMLGSSAAWLRARLIADGTRPPLVAVRTNTMWADQQASIVGETLGSGTGQPSQQFQTTQQPVLQGQILEVLEPESPTGGELAALGPGAVSPAQDATGQSAGAWVTWTEVSDFVASGPRDRNYVIDRVPGVVTFGDGQRGLVPPVGRGNVKVTYAAGGGQVGNVATGTITQLRTAIPFVSAVTNYEAAGGGADVEDLSVAGARGPTTLRNRGRAVAAADYEDLALGATSGVARALAISAAGPADAGSVGLVIVPAQSGPRPTPDGELLAQVSAYVSERMSPTATLSVAGPGWLEVSVTAALVPVLAEQASDVQSAALVALSAFLDPVTGGAGQAGWPFGREVHAADLIALLESLEDLDHVASLDVEQTLTEAPPSPGAFLVTSGQHTITMLTPGPTV
ncbi:MAG TPA: putative baseplate assembly protein [Solirubrobacteraceae bacterium]|nr:putative baseplate assembly protein [Solirubrobacteraceae bacterium]